MIDAKELRIGNYFYDRGGKLLCLDYWDLNNKMCMSYDPYHPFTEYPEYAEPIPLTEQWLIDLGAERIVGWDDMIIFRITHNKMVADVEQLDKGFENDMGMVINSVHEYQNYIRFTLGKELTKQNNPL
jgi:hypothetical protein